MYQDAKKAVYEFSMKIKTKHFGVIVPPRWKLDNVELSYGQRKRRRLQWNS